MTTFPSKLHEYRNLTVSRALVVSVRLMDDTHKANSELHLNGITGTGAAGSNSAKVTEKQAVSAATTQIVKMKV